MKKGLIGISNNVKSNKDKIRVWSESFKRYVPDGEVILLVANSTEEDIDADFNIHASVSCHSVNWS